MVDCLSWHSCYGHIRSSKLYSKEKRLTPKKYADQQYSIPKQISSNINTKSNFSCISSDEHSSKKQLNTNNNNNASSSSSSSSPTADEHNSLLQFHMINVSRERNLHLSTNSNDKRLIIFYNIANGLYKMGLRNGDVLIFLNELNILKPPVALTIDRVKAEFTSLRRQSKIIQIGVCRSSDRSLFNNTTVKHLGALAFDEFKNLSYTEELNENQKPSPTVETKKRVHLFSNKKKTLSSSKRNSASNRDSGFTETDDPSIISYSNKNQSKTSAELSEEDDSLATLKSLDSSQQSIKKKTSSPADQMNVPSSKSSGGISPHQLFTKFRQSQRSLATQVITDACFIYRRQTVKKPTSDAMILRGREIAYQAANSPTIPSSVPSYTHDQIRELYGEVDKKTRRLQEHEYILHTPMIDAWHEKSPWISSFPVKNQLTEECPLPKFHPDKLQQTKLMSSYLSTGLSNPRIKPIKTIDLKHDQGYVRGSFRTSIADRTTISPSPILLDINFDFNKLSSSTDDQSSVFENTQQGISCISNNDSTEKYTEITNNIASSSMMSDQSSSTKNFNEQSIISSNKTSSTTSKLALSQAKTCETMEMDSLIDIDDETTISYNTAEESRLETDPDSLFSIKNNQNAKSHHQSMDTDSLSRHNDFLYSMKSPANSFYDALTASIQTNNQHIFNNTYLEPIEMLNHQENLYENQPSSTIDIDNLIMKGRDRNKNSAIDNLIKIIHDISERQSCVNDTPVVYNSRKLQIEEESKTNENLLLTEISLKNPTDNQNQPLILHNIDEVIDQTLRSQSQESTSKKFDEINNLEAIPDDIQPLIKISPEPEQYLNTVESNISPIDDLSPIFNRSILTNQSDNDDSFIIEENRSYEITNDADEDFESLYQRYLTNLEQYQSMMQQINEYEQKEKLLTPITEESKLLIDLDMNDKDLKPNDIEQFCFAINVKRQSNHIGHYGFELGETSDGKIIVSSIIDSYYCPDLNIDDEIIGINNTFTFTTLEQYYLLFHSLWYKPCEYVQIFINKPSNISIIKGTYK
ncbi:unnamed protein product [Rotaria socialis]|uniref:PDZ domain-containing protein n=1 Tax=Rotaria socialis TaxID=392032 RepID=A0A818ABY5_9BILA|nr:unnamed protein product [Rotaria socialis]CAF4694432.1 unnamed protein product [Rotaria socialis]